MVNEESLDKQLELIPPAFINLVICRDLFTQRIERELRPLGLNMTSISLLSHFARKPNKPWTISELVNVMGIHQPGITKATMSMVKQNWLMKADNENDGRTKHLFITADGLSKLQEAQKRTFPHLLEGFSGLGLPQIEQLLSTLGKIKDRLEMTRPKATSGE